MEVREIISFYINTENEVLEVDFRLTQDSDNEVRSSEIQLSELVDFGLNINHEKMDVFEEIEDDFDSMNGLDEEFEEELTHEDLLSFLNEYYLVNPNRLPEPDLF